MTRTLVRLAFTALVVIASPVVDSSARADVMRYDAVDLGELPGYSQSVANGLNDRGDVVGYSVTGYGDSTPFLYSGGKLTSLAPTYHDAYGINNSGQIAGTASYDHINNLGQMVGASGIGKEGHISILLGNTVTDIGGFASSTLTNPSAINDSGQVVGGAIIGDVYHPFLYSNGHFTDLGLQGAHDGEATGINNRGQVSLTYSGPFSTDERGALFSNGHFTDLGSLGGKGTGAYGINDLGQIVGSSTTVSGQSHAFLYESGMMRDLNALIASGGGMTLYSAERINNRGQIIASATDATGGLHAYLLTPRVVPEPSTLTLATVFGAALLGRWTWRQRRSVVATRKP